MIEKKITVALLGIADGRVFPDVAPLDATFPYVTYQQVGGQPNNTLDGPDTLQNARVQIDTFSNTRLSANETMDAVFAILTAGALKAIPVGGPISTYDNQLKTYRRSLDFSIWS
jgi:hypothetical protein